MLVSRTSISQEKFRKFLLAVRKQYHDRNPYHNFRHAFDVTHMIYLMLTKGILGFRCYLVTPVANAAQYLGSVEVLAVLLSGLLHDVDHPGLNNTFQVFSHNVRTSYYDSHRLLLKVPWRSTTTTRVSSRIITVLLATKSSLKTAYVSQSLRLSIDSLYAVV